jgi:hypothetical protein
MTIQILVDQNLLDFYVERTGMLEQENAIKLEQILDLEQILWDTRIIELLDNSPCWCCLPSATNGVQDHDETCTKARKATEPFWKGATK